MNLSNVTEIYHGPALSGKHCIRSILVSNTYTREQEHRGLLQTSLHTLHAWCLFTRESSSHTHSQQYQNSGLVSIPPLRGREPGSHLKHPRMRIADLCFECLPWQYLPKLKHKPVGLNAQSVAQKSVLQICGTFASNTYIPSHTCEQYCIRK